MNKDDTIRQRILDYCGTLFMKYGFSGVTTDDIASEVGISKKTLYKYFKSKESLVKEVTERFAADYIKTAGAIVRDKKIDFVKKIMKVMTLSVEQYSKIGEPFAHDIKKYLPAFYKIMDERRRDEILSNFGRLVDEGIKKGVFRRDINKKVVVLVYLNAMRAIIVPETLAQLPFSASQLYEMIARIVYEGIMTENGRKMFKGC